jgi:hypothetical protein
MITFVCWKWKSPSYRVEFTAEHVNTLVDMLAVHCSLDHRVLCITDDPTGVKCATYPIWNDLANLQNPCAPPGSKSLPSCYRRLKIFDPEVTSAMGFEPGESLVSIDLDCVLMADIAPILRKHETWDFAGWQALSGFAWKQPWYFHGSFWRFRAGRLPFVWTDFSAAISPQTTAQLGFFGTDQAWITFKLGKRFPGWTRQDGIAPFNLSLHGVRHSMGKAPPPGTRIVFFNGSHKPWDENVRQRWPWIREHWPPALVTRPALV